MKYERTREDDSRTPLSKTGTATQCNGSSTTVDTPLDDPSTGLFNGSYRRTKDWVTDHFQQRVSAGEIINNPFYSIKRRDESSLTGEWAWYDPPCTGTAIMRNEGNGPRSYTFGFKEDWQFPMNTEAAARTIAGTQAWANVSAPELLGGETLRDLHRTLRLFVHPLEGFHEMLHKVRNTNKFRSQAKSLGQFIAGSWLQYRYGATPALLDLQAATHAMLIPQYSTRLTARGSASCPEFTSEEVTNLDSDSMYYGVRTHRVIRNTYFRAGVLYQHVVTVPDTYGLSIHNIVPTLWEFLPYSFVADWFVNVGDWLSAVVPKGGVKVLASWTTRKSETVYTRELTGSPKTYGSRTITGGPGFISTRSDTVTDRQPGASRGLAFRLNDLDFQKSKNWLHIADGLTLAGQYLMSRPNQKAPRMPRDRTKSSNYKAWRGVAW